MTRYRVEYVDALRGVGILMMVWVHTVWLLFGASHSWLQGVGVLVTMPVLFAVSGYVRGGRHAGWRKTVVRCARLLMWLLLASAFASLCMQLPFAVFFSTQYFYWYFTLLIIFEISGEILIRIMDCNSYGVWVSTFGALLIWGISAMAYQYFGDVSRGIPWGDFERYWLFYWFGVLMRRNHRFMDKVTSPWIICVGALAGAVSIYTWQTAGFPAGMAGGLGALLALWGVARRCDGRLKFMAWIGRQSLGIFILSYPVLYWLSPWGELMPQQWRETILQIVPATVAALPLTVLMADAWWWIKRLYLKIIDIHIIGKK